MAFTKAQAKALCILEVAKSLGMEMERSSHKEYYWKEHDSFKINTVKNTWNWYSRTGKFGDTINLVQEIKGVSYKEAMTFLETGNFPEATIVEEERKPFRYTLAPYEQPFRKARSYLKETRGLSDETIDFFLEKGVLAEASYRDRDGYVEDVLVFKFLNRNHHIVGASLQGLSSFPDRHEGKGYLKKIMYQSEGVAGLNVAIGSPKRLIVAEAPIDLMSYYELHKDELEDVSLVAMDGLKVGTLSRYAMEVLQERGDAKEVVLDYTQSKDLIRASNFLSETARLTNVFHDNNHQDFLTLAVDNDKAGQDFIDQLQEKKIPVVDGRPPKATNEKKMDWNAYLQLKKKGQLMEHQNKRLTQNKEVEPHRKETKSKKTKTAEEHYFDWIERMAATVQEQLQLPSPPKSASELEAVVEPFITTDLDRLFARRLSLALDTYRVEPSQILSVHQAIDQLDKQINEQLQEKESQTSKTKESAQTEKDTDPERVLYQEMRERVKALEQERKSRELDSFYADSWEHAAQIRDDIRRIDEEISEASKLYTQQVHQLTQSRIEGIKDDIVRSAFDRDREMFVKTLGLMQKYSIEEVLNSSDVHPEDDVNRYQSLKRDMRTINLGPVHNFIESYMGDTEIKLVGDFDENNQLYIYVVGADRVSVQDFIDIAQEQGIVRVEDIPTVEPWKSPILDDYEIEPDIQANQRIQELLGQLEELGQTAYFWVTEEDLDQPKEVVAQLDQWFSLGEVHSVYESDTFELVVGDNTYMIEFKNGKHSLQNMEAYAQTVSEWIEEVGVDTVALHLEATIEEFNQVKQSLTEGMDKQLQAIQQSLLRQPSPVESVQAGIGRFFERVQKQARAIFEQEPNSDQKENALEQAQGHEKSAEGTIGDFPAKQEAAPLPEANESQPLNDLSPSQTQPQPLLHFTTKDDGKSIEKRYYHLASEKDIAKLNRYAPTIQQTAQWYLDTIADSHVIYLYKDGGSISSLAVQFDRDKFMHLTGIFPYREHQTASQTLEDFANGKGDFDSILIANKGAAFDKIKVLPELEAIIQSDSFYFGDLSEVPKLKQLDMDKAIRSGDEDVVLAMRTVDGTTFPASLLKLRQTLALQLDHSTEERTILGVYRYRDSQLDQLSINQEYIKDGGEVFKPILDQVVENLNQSTSSEPNMEEDMVYHNQPSFEGQMSEKTKPESVDQSSYAQPSSQNKLNELLASKDRAGLAQHLKEGIHQYLDSTQYKEFLKTMSRFPQYSYRNVMLLKAQKPDVQAVTSFKSWKEDFGRSVKKGEKSLRIFAPMVVKAKDPETGEILKDDKGNDVTRTIFKLVPVFDVSQTEGKELPQPIYQLEGTHENYSKLYRSAKEYAQSKGLRLEFDANLGEANGYYSRKDQTIVIKSGMSEQQTLKTIYHELAHADLHSSKTTDKELKYSHAELQAESVAYIVSNHYGLDTSSYTFAYLASWTEDKTALTDLEAQLEIVQKEAQQLIYSLDRELEKQLEQTKEVVKPVEKLSFEERLARAEKQSHALVEQQRKEEEQSKKQEGKLPNQER